MKITPNTYNPTLHERSQPINNQNKPASSSTTTRSAEVALSSTARHLQQVQASSSEDVNVSRVQALRESVANGSFEIDSNKIADGLISGSKELLS